MPSLDLIARFIGVDAGAGREFDRMSGKAASTGAAMTKFAIGSGVALAAVAVGSIKAAADYQKLTVNLVTGAGEQQRNLKMVSDGMLSMAGQVGDSASTLAKAMFTVESAGYHGAAGLTVLKVAAQGAKVDNADLSTVVEALTSSLNAYHEPASKAAQVTNTLIASASVGKMHLQDLADALGTVLPTAAALGVPLDQVGAAMATMTMQGTNSARAATYLRFAFSALANPSAKASDAMKQVGLTSTKVATTLQTGGLPAVFAQLEDAVGKKFPVGSAKYVAALANMVGGTRGLQAVLELTGTHLATMNSNLTTIDDRVRKAGNSVSDWSMVQKNFNQQLDEFAAGLQASAIRLGTDLLPAATDLLKLLEGGGHVIGDVAGFFEHDRAAALALAAVLTTALYPAIARNVVMLGRIVALNGGAALFMVKDAALGAATAFGEADGATAGFSAALKSLNINPAILALTAVVAAGAELTHVLRDQNGAAFAAGAKATATYVKSLDDTHTSLQQTTQDTASLTTRINTLRSAQSVLSSQTIGQAVTLVAARNKSIAAGKTEAANEAQLASQYGLSKTRVEALAKANGIDLTGSYQRVSSAVLAAAGPMPMLTNALKVIGKSAAGSANQVNSLATAIDTLLGNFLGVKQAELDFHNDLVSLDAALVKSKGSLSDNTKAGAAARAEYLTTAGALGDVANAMAKNGAPTDTIRNKMLAMLGVFAKTPAGGKLVTDTLAHIKSVAHNLNLEAAGFKAGENLASGLAAGIEARSGVAIAKAQDLGEQAVHGINTGAGNKSPSVKTFKSGVNIVQGLINGVASKTLDATAVTRLLAEGMIGGWTGEAAQIKDALTTPIQNALTHLTSVMSSEISKQQTILKSAESHYKSLEQARKSAIGSTRSSIVGTTDIGGVLGQTNQWGQTYTGNVGSSLTSSLALVKREARGLAQLRKMGLSQALLSQISQQSPTDALTLIGQILSGQDGSVGSLNKTEALIQQYAKASATTVVDSPHRQKKLAHAQEATWIANATLDEIKRMNRHLEGLAAEDVARHVVIDIHGDTLKLTQVDAKTIVAAIDKLEHTQGHKKAHK